MSVPYDVFVGAFLSKMADFDFCDMDPTSRDDAVHGYMKRAIANFKKNCKYDLTTTADDETFQFNVTIDEEDLDEIVDIISEGMIVQWLKPYVYKQENLENVINSRDWTMYSPAELLMRIGNAYNKAQRDFTNMIREYSYNNNDLTELHL